MYSYINLSAQLLLTAENEHFACGIRPAGRRPSGAPRRPSPLSYRKSMISIFLKKYITIWGGDPVNFAYATSKNSQLGFSCVYIDMIGFSSFSLNIDITRVRFWRATPNSKNSWNGRGFSAALPRFRIFARGNIAWLCFASKGINKDNFRRAARARICLGKQVIMSRMQIFGALRAPESVWESKLFIGNP